MMPFMGAIGVCLVMVIGYEWSIAHPASEDYDTDSSPIPRLDTAFNYNAAR
jgi:hypothetical protein